MARTDLLILERKGKLKKYLEVKRQIFTYEMGNDHESTTIRPDEKIAEL
jgi:hypothetical protein